MSSIALGRLQFAVTAMFHWIFVPLTLGLAILIGIMETKYYLASKNSANKETAEFWKKTTKFWSRIFAINFAIGVATGIILEFQFGTNWSNYSWFVGDIFGAPLAIEGIFAFFMESTFFAVMYFGWDKVSKRFHLASTWLTAIGANLSAVWILIANSWMQNPVGMAFNPDTARNEMSNFREVVFSPVAMNKLLHTASSSFMLAAVVVIGICGWYLLKKRDRLFAVKSMKTAAVFGLIAALFMAYSGDGSAYLVSKYQPMKLAAMEGLYKGESNAPLVAVAILNPNKDITNDEEPYLFDISLPGALSLLANRSFDSFVPGIEDIINGGYTYEDPYGNKVEALSFDEKHQKGKMAVEGLKNYQSAIETGNDSLKVASYNQLQDNFQYFGYSFIDTPQQIIPPVALTFYAFRIMVILGGYFILFFVAVLLLLRKEMILTIKESYQKLIYWIMILGIPMVYVCSQSGWIVAEVGRQPWTIQDLLPVQAAASAVPPGNIYATLAIFFILFTLLLVAELRIMFNQINKGPEKIS